jgi:hypothetical protein
MTAYVRVVQIALKIFSNCSAAEINHSNRKSAQYHKVFVRKTTIFMNNYTKRHLGFLRHFEKNQNTKTDDIPALTAQRNLLH